MNPTKAAINSLKIHYGEQRLKNLTSQWLDKYTSRMDDFQLCELFEDVFGESPSYFEIKGNAKSVAEKLMMLFYHNEACIKSRIVDLLKKEKNVTFFEMPLLDSRIDVCSINGHSCAYEIKTIYDTTRRLKKQADDYLRVFEMVYVVCPYEKITVVTNIVPDCVGIIAYDDRDICVELAVFRAARISDCINPITQFNLLHKKERFGAIQFIDDVPRMNEYFKECLKKRYSKKWCSFKKICASVNRLDYQFCFNLS